VVDFSEALAAGADALDSLSLKADALSFAATDDQDVGLAQQAKKFATVAGPRGLQRAQAKGDGNELMLVQRGIAGVSTDVTDALVDDVIERFVLMDLGVLLVGPFGMVAGLAPESELEAAKSAANNVPMPPAPQDLPWPAFIGAGAAGGALLAFTNTGNPRAAIGGAVGGAALGALVKYALQQLGDKFNLFGSTTHK
jgi:hypothetical protein